MASRINQNQGSPSNQSSDGNNPICRRYTCRDCMREFDSLSNLSVHRELHYNKPRECFKCGKKYKRYTAFYMHYKTHDLIHECEICGHKFSREYLLRKHVERHNGAINCTRCGRIFVDSHSLIEHKRRVHNKKKIFKCVKCPRSYAIMSSLKRHMVEKHEPNNEVRSVPQIGEPSTSS